MSYLILLVVLCILFGRGLKIKKVCEESLVLQHLNSLRGIDAVLIIIGHCSMRFNQEPIFLYFIHKTNMAWVSYFLMISVWGMACSFSKNSGYLDDFLFKKLSGLGGITILSAFFYWLANLIYFQDKISFLSYINWYIYEACFFYVIFWLAFLFFHTWSLRIWVCSLAAAALCMTAWFNSWEHAYYYSAFAFPFGIIVHKYGNERGGVKTGVAGLISVVVSMVLYSWKNYILVDIFLHNLFGTGFCLILITICRYIKIGNKITGMLSRISAELYLYQFIILRLWKKLFIDLNLKINLLYVMTVVISCIICSMCIWNVDCIVKRTVIKHGKRNG